MNILPLSRYRAEWFTGAAGARREVLAGMVGTFALIPEVIASSFVTGIDPEVGLTTAIPSPLVCVVVPTVVAVAVPMPMRTVADLGRLPASPPTPAIPSLPFAWETLAILAPYALAMAAVGLLESMMTASVVDDLTETGSDKARECIEIPARTGDARKCHAARTRGPACRARARLRAARLAGGQLHVRQRRRRDRQRAGLLIGADRRRAAYPPPTAPAARLCTILPSRHELSPGRWYNDAIILGRSR